MACRSGHYESVLLLIARGARVGQVNNNGASPLLVACQAGRVDVARLLIDSGANVDQASNPGGLPLVVACMNGHPEIVRLLLRGGADIYRTTRPGFSPLIVARASVAAGDAREGPGAELIVSVAGPWSPETHDARSTAARARAVDLVRLGKRLSTSGASLTPAIRAWLRSEVGRTFWLRVMTAAI